jgi:hypothetical protein
LCSVVCVLGPTILSTTPPPPLAINLLMVNIKLWFFLLFVVVYSIQNSGTCFPKSWDPIFRDKTSRDSKFWGKMSWHNHDFWKIIEVESRYHFSFKINIFFSYMFNTDHSDLSKKPSAAFPISWDYPFKAWASYFLYTVYSALWRYLNHHLVTLHI